MSAFHLLRLPLLAFEHVLCMMNPYELVNVSLASSRTKKVVKNISRPRPKFRVSFIINDQPCISIIGKHPEINSWEYSWTSHDPIIFLAKYPNSKKITHVDMKIVNNPIETFLEFYDYINEVFGCSIQQVNYELNPFLRGRCEKIMDFLSQQAIRDLRIYGSWPKESPFDVKYHLSELKISGMLVLDVSQAGNNFQLEIPKGFPRLDVSKSKFINYEQFLSLKHPEMILNDCIYSGQVINRFLKSWIACESHFDLKSVLIVVQRPIIEEEILIGIPHEVTSDPDVMKKFKRCPFHATFDEGFNIKRSDGKVATICIARLTNYSRLCLIIH
uniref:F-box domain-containing protein n=1 Tax=Caenorhabditis tropicalis TaxID=1561998 RepID=A0A1I7TH71_9PELO